MRGRDVAFHRLFDGHVDVGDRGAVILVPNGEIPRCERRARDLVSRVRQPIRELQVAHHDKDVARDPSSRCPRTPGRYDGDRHAGATADRRAPTCCGLGTVYAWDPVERRIFGLENEYGITATFRGQRRLSPDEVARYLFRKVVSWGRSSNVFLANGARLYLDVGSHPESATPECDSLLDLVTHDKAGERILEQLVASAEQRLREEGVRCSVYVLKNNTDSAGNSYGCHENYLTEPAERLGHCAEVLIPSSCPARSSRGPARCCRRPGGRSSHLPAGRAHLGGGVVGDDSEPADHRRPRRALLRRREVPAVHVIIGGSNMSEYTTFLKFGAAGVLLRMLEDPSVVLRDMTLENPIRAIREMSHDLTCTRKVRLANGREVSAWTSSPSTCSERCATPARRGSPPLEQARPGDVGALHHDAGD